MNLIKYRYLYFAISLVIIIPGILALIFWGLPLGIDFTGGSLLDVQFKSGNPPTIANVAKVYSDLSTAAMDISDPEVQPLGTDSISIRSREMDDATKAKVVAALKDQFGGGQDVVIQNFSQVTASVGAGSGPGGSHRGRHGFCCHFDLHLVRLPQGAASLPVWRGSHYRNDPRYPGCAGCGSHLRSFPGLAGRFALPDRPVDRDRLFGARRPSWSSTAFVKTPTFTAGWNSRPWSTTRSFRPWIARSTPS